MAERRPLYAPEYRRQMVCASLWCGQVARPGSWLACSAQAVRNWVRPSTGSVGDCYDNAMAESFFATLECELIDRRSFRTRAQAKREVFDFVEGWYNPGRRHSALGYLSGDRCSDEAPAFS